MSHDNVQIVRKWFDDVWNKRCEAAIEERLTEHSICYSDFGTMLGPSGFREKMYLPLIKAFPDIHVTFDAIVSQHESVVVRWTATATHAGEGLDCQATGTPVTFRGMSWVDLHHQKFTKGWTSSNIPAVIHEIQQHARTLPSNR